MQGQCCVQDTVDAETVILTCCDLQLPSHMILALDVD